MIAPLCEGVMIANLFGSTPAANSAANNYGEVVQLRSALNDDFSSVSRKIKKKKDYISEPIINRPSPWRPPVYKMDTVFRESKLA